MASATEWGKRVAAWRASGQSSDAFAAGRGFAGATLRWWSSKLKREGSPPVRLARVVVARAATTTAGQGLIVEMRGARVLVPPGVDRATLATVLAALGDAS